MNYSKGDFICFESKGLIFSRETTISFIDLYVREIYKTTFSIDQNGFEYINLELKEGIYFVNVETPGYDIPSTKIVVK